MITTWYRCKYKVDNLCRGHILKLIMNMCEYRQNRSEKKKRVVSQEVLAKIVIPGCGGVGEGVLGGGERERETMPNATLVGYREEDEEEKRFIYYWLLVRSYVPSVKSLSILGYPRKQRTRTLT